MPSALYVQQTERIKITRSVYFVGHRWAACVIIPVGLPRSILQGYPPHALQLHLPHSQWLGGKAAHAGGERAALLPPACGQKS